MWPKPKAGNADERPDEGSAVAGEQEDVAPARSAQEYIDAAESVAKIAGDCTAALARGVRFRDVISIARELADVAPGVIDAATPLANKVADQGNKAAVALTKRSDEWREANEEKKQARAYEETRRKMREALLRGAGTRVSAQQFMQDWETQHAPGGAGSYLAFVGCYVFVTRDALAMKDDFSHPRGVYVGRSRDMGTSIRADLVGLGNPDVYADFKYKQNLCVLLYPCNECDLDQLESSLIVTLDADASYNAPRMLG